MTLLAIVISLALVDFFVRRDASVIGSAYKSYKASQDAKNKGRTNN